MKLIRQVLSDIRKEIGWIIFFGVLMSAVIITFISVTTNYRRTAERNRYISSFTDNNVMLTYIYDTEYKVDKEEVPVSSGEKEDFYEYLSEVFSEDGNAGNYFSMGSGVGDKDLGFDNIYVLLGTYADRTPYKRDRSEQISFAVSYDLKDTVGETITIEDREFPLHVAPENMSIYHPMTYISNERGRLDNTLFVFTRDVDLLREVFPSNNYWDLFKKELYFYRFILDDPTEDDLVRVKKVVSENIGGYLSTQSIFDRIKSVEEVGVRTHSQYLILYISAIVILLVSMFLNIYKILTRKTTEYATHYLFGATDSFIYARMLLFAFSYNIIPLVLGVYTVIKESRFKTVPGYSIALLTAGFAVMLFSVTGAAYRRFHGNFEKGLRRE